MVSRYSLPACRYIYAKDWEALTQTALNYMADSPLDEVIQLCHASKPKQVSPNVRPLVYFNIEDVLPLLNATHIAKLSSVENDPKTIGTNTANLIDSSVDRMSERQTDQLAAEPEDPKNEDDEETEPSRVAFTAEQTAAASKIIAVYRKYAERKASEKDPMDEMRRRIRKDFLSKSRTIEWQGSPYRLLFRRVLPHLFTATECVKDRLYGAKSAAKESLRNAHDAELESVQAALDDAS